EPGAFLPGDALEARSHREIRRRVPRNAVAVAVAPLLAAPGPGARRLHQLGRRRPPRALSLSGDARIQSPPPAAGAPPRSTPRARVAKISCALRVSSTRVSMLSDPGMVIARSAQRDELAPEHQPPTGVVAGPGPPGIAGRVGGRRDRQPGWYRGFTSSLTGTGFLRCMGAHG